MLAWFKRRKPKQEAANGSYRHGNEHLIELRQVTKVYETAAGPFVALKEVNLQVDPAEFVAVTGKSGSGKSTLINMMTGIDRPTRGEVLVGDTAVHRLNEGQIAVWRGRNVGVIFQFFQLLPTLTALENVMLPMDFGHMFTLAAREERALDLLEQVELAQHAGKLPSALSGGEQQRVAIARAMANDPPILVADEPTGNLDSQTAEAMMQLFEKLVSQGKTIVMVTHELDLARRAGRIITLADGQIVAETMADPTTALRPGRRPIGEPEALCRQVQARPPTAATLQQSPSVPAGSLSSQADLVGENLLQSGQAEKEDSYV